MVLEKVPNIGEKAAKVDCGIQDVEPAACRADNTRKAKIFLRRGESTRSTASTHIDGKRYEISPMTRSHFTYLFASFFSQFDFTKTLI